MAQTALPLRGFFGQNMVFVRVLALYFSGSGELKTLFSTGVRFHFRHNTALFSRVKKEMKQLVFLILFLVVVLLFLL